MGKVYIVRHGKTRFNTGNPATDRAKGQAYDLPLTEEGHAEAKLDAKKLASRSIKEIHHGPLRRSRETATHIAAATGASNHNNDDLKPWDVGYLSGQLRAEIADRIEYYIRHKNRPVPDGEPYVDFYKRTTDSLASILKRAAALDDEAIVVVGHSDEIEAWEAFLTGRLPEAHTVKNAAATGAILVLEKRGSRWTMSECEGRERDEV
jgi:broad specificity phosphatase PhoE